MIHHFMLAASVTLAAEHLDPPQPSDRFVNHLAENIIIDPDGELWWTEVLNAIVTDEDFAAQDALEFIAPTEQLSTLPNTTPEGKAAFERFRQYNYPVPYWINIKTGEFSGPADIIKSMNREMLTEIFGEYDIFRTSIMRQETATGAIHDVHTGFDEYGDPTYDQIHVSRFPSGAFPGDTVPLYIAGPNGKYRIGDAEIDQWLWYDMSTAPLVSMDDFMQFNAKTVRICINDGTLTRYPTEIKPRRYIAERRTSTTPVVHGWKWRVTWRDIP